MGLILKDFGLRMGNGGLSLDLMDVPSNLVNVEVRVSVEIV